MEIELAVRLPDGRKCKIEKVLVGKYNLKAGLYTPFTHYLIERVGIDKVWTKEDEKFLLENWGKIPWQELAQRLGITPNAIRKKYARLKRSLIPPSSDTSFKKIETKEVAEKTEDKPQWTVDEEKVKEKEWEAEAKKEVKEESTTLETLASE